MKNHKHWGHKTAEIISFVFSSGIILTLLIILGIEHFKGDDSPYLDMRATIMKEEIHRVSDQFLIPIKVENRGSKTPTKTTFRIEMRKEGMVENQFLEVEYLSKRSSRIIYLSRKEDPSQSDMKIQLVSYQF